MEKNDFWKNKVINKLFYFWPEFLKQKVRLKKKTGDSFETLDELVSLWRAADKYDVKGLKRLAEGRISGTVNNGNDAEVLATAEVMDMEGVKDFLVSFLAAKKSDAGVEGWWRGASPELVERVLDARAGKLHWYPVVMTFAVEWWSYKGLGEK